MNTTGGNASSFSSGFWNLCDSNLPVYVSISLVYFVLGVPIFGYVLWLIATGNALASEIFIFNIAAAELVFCLWVPVVTTAHLLIAGLQHYAETIVFPYGVVYCSRPLFHCCICLECYLAVVPPVVFLKYKPLRYRVGLVASVWGGVAAFTGAFSAYLPDFPVSGYNIFLMVTLIVDLFCSLSILHILKRPAPGQGEMERRGGGGGGGGGGRRGERTQWRDVPSEEKAFFVVSVVFLTMLTDRLPFVVMYFLFGNVKNYVYCVIDSITMSFSCACGLVQPLLYLHSAGKLSCIRGL